MYRIALYVSITICITGCSKDNNPVDSIDYGDTDGAIFLSSFESNNDSTLSNWYVSSNLRNLFSFSKDVPKGGGHWSLCIQGTQGTGLGIEATKDIAIDTRDSSVEYTLSFWAKGLGYAILMIKDSTGGWLNDIKVNSAEWKLFTISNNQQETNSTSIEVRLGASFNDSTSTVYFDNIKLIKKHF